MPAELTAAEKIELAKAEAETETAKAATAQALARTEELQKQNRDMTLNDTFTKEIADSGITPRLPQKDLVKLLEAEPGVVIKSNADGSTLFCEKDGKEIKFADLLGEYALGHSNLFDGRSLKKLRVDETKVRSMEDLPDQEDKIAFIAKHGDLAFGRLPAHPGNPPKDPAKMTAQQWKDLPMSERARLCGELSEEQLARIHQRKTEKK